MDDIHATAPLPRLFISAVVDELKTVSFAVAAMARHLGYEVVSLADLPASESEPRTWMREQIDACEGLILLTGVAYGPEPEVQDPVAHGLPSHTLRYSFAQYAFLYARAHGFKTWAIHPGPGSKSDTPVKLLDLPKAAAVADPAAWQAERRQLQARWIEHLKDDGHLRCQPRNKRALYMMLGILRQRGKIIQLRFARWEDVAVAQAVMTQKARVFLKPVAVMYCVLVGVLGCLFTRGLGSHGSGKGTATHGRGGYASRRSSHRVDYVKNLDSYQRAAALVNKEAEPLKWASAQLWVAASLQDLGRYTEAEPLMREAVRIREARLGPDQSDVASALNCLGYLLSLTHRTVEAEALMRRALKIDEDALGPDHLTVASRLINLSSLLCTTHRFEGAEPMLRRALKIDEKALGPEHSTVAAVLTELAWLLQQTQRPLAAEPLLRRALKIDEAALGPDHPDVALRLNNLATLLRETNHRDEAERLMRRALKIDEKAFGLDHDSRQGAHLNNLALLLEKGDRPMEAEPLYRRAVKVNEEALGPDHPALAINLNNLARLLKEYRRPAEAEPLIRRALKIEETAFGPDDPEVIKSLGGLAQVLQLNRNLVEAEQAGRRALKMGLLVQGRTGTKGASLTNDIGGYIGILRDQLWSEDEMRPRLDALADEVAMDRAAFRIQWERLVGPFDVTVREVLADGQGSGLGMQVGDVIRRYDELDIVAREQVTRMTGQIEGRDVRMEIQTSGRPVMLTVKPGRLGVRLTNKRRPASSPAAPVPVVAAPAGH